jgi:hypothetical protein
MPVLLAINKDNGTINPITGPEIYHGHGCLINSIMFKEGLLLIKIFYRNAG